jgi:hypothetical protein
MPPTAHLRAGRGFFTLGRRWAGRLPYRLGQRDKIIIRRGWWAELPVVAHQFPSSGSCQPYGMVLTEIVRMGLRIRSERTNDRSRLGVHIGQRRDRRPRATVTGASPW